MKFRDLSIPIAMQYIDTQAALTFIGVKELLQYGKTQSVGN
jgi:hypothetical protein